MYFAFPCLQLKLVRCLASEPRQILPLQSSHNSLPAELIQFSDVALALLVQPGEARPGLENPASLTTPQVRNLA